MDFSNEHYVRLYTRDTTTWKLLGFAGQAVLSLVIRKLDMAGVLDLDELEPWEGALLHCGIPEDIAKEGMAKCLKYKVFAHTGRALVMPRYVEAQTASKSDKQRQKESRDRRRLEVMTPVVTNGHDKPDSVTPRHGGTQNGTAPSHTVTDPSRPVTPGHAPSQPVTLCSSDTNSNAVRGVAGAPRAPTPAEQAEEDEIDPPEPALPPPPLHTLVQLAWWEVVHNGHPSGVESIAAHDCADMLESRKLGVERFKSATREWLADRKSSKPPKLAYLAEDLAGYLMERRAPVARSVYANDQADRQMREDLRREQEERERAARAVEPVKSDPEAELAAWKAEGGKVVIDAEDDEDAA